MTSEQRLKIGLQFTRIRYYQPVKKLMTDNIYLIDVLTTPAGCVQDSQGVRA